MKIGQRVVDEYGNGFVLLEHNTDGTIKVMSVVTKDVYSATVDQIEPEVERL